MSFPEFWPGWETVRVIGTGGFGKVYEIRKKEDESGGNYVSALKVISIPQDRDEISNYFDEGYNEESIDSIFTNQVKEIVSEFELMAQFKGTSNIVSYEDHKIIPHENEHGYDILIKMELLTSLPSYYNQRGMTERDVVNLAKDMCTALEMCQKKKIIHRDIKPQNIFINEFGNYKLGDFGIAKNMEGTMSGTRIGTFNYIAPEVYKDQPYNATVDIYSLGLVLYWLLNERRGPFLPLGPTVTTSVQKSDALSKRMSGESLPAPKYGSKRLKEIVLKACAYDSKDRFQSASEMAEALSKLRGSATVVSTITPVAEKATEAKALSEAKNSSVNDIPLDENTVLDEESTALEETVLDEGTAILEETVLDEDVTSLEAEAKGIFYIDEEAVEENEESEDDEKGALISKPKKKFKKWLKIVLIALLLFVAIFISTISKIKKSDTDRTTVIDLESAFVTTNESDDEETTEEEETESETDEDDEAVDEETTANQAKDDKDTVVKKESTTKKATTTTTKKTTTPEEAFAKWKNGTATENDMAIIAGYINSRIASSSEVLLEAEFKKKYVFFDEYGDGGYITHDRYSSIYDLANTKVSSAGYKISRIPKTDEDWWGYGSYSSERLGYEYNSYCNDYVLLSSTSSGKICYIEDKAEAEKRMRGY